MTILVTADLHWSDNPRDEYRHTFWRWFIETAKARKPSAVFVLGDLCQEKDRHPAELVNRVVEHLHRLSKVCPVVVLRGNHDYKTIHSPFYRFLGRISGLWWVGSPTDGSGLPGVLTADLGPTIFLPHTRDHARDWAGIDFEQYRWAFAHNTFRGARARNILLEGIPTEIFPERLRIVSGDVHARQTLGNVTYVGAPYTIDFGDNYLPRILEIQGKKMTSIRAAGPQKRLVEISNPNELPYECPFNKGDIVKIRVAISQKQRGEWPTISAELRALAENAGALVASVRPRFIDNKARARLPSGTPKSDKQYLTEYATLRRVDAATLKAGLRYLEQE